MLENNLFILKNTKLNINIKVKIQKRFYPQQMAGTVTPYIYRGLTVPRIPLHNSLTSSNPLFRSSNLLSDNRCLTRKMNYPRFQSERSSEITINSIFGIYRHNKDKEKAVVKSIEKRNIYQKLESFIEGSMPLSPAENLSITLSEINEAGMQQLSKILLSCIQNKCLISPVSLKNLLHYFYNTENFSQIQEEIVGYLRFYFKDNSPTFEDALMFLHIWDKSGLVWSSQAFNLKEKNETTNVNKNSVVKKEKLSFEEKQKKILNELNVVKKNMDNIFKQYSNDPQKILNSKELKAFIEFFTNRGSALPLQIEEYDRFSTLKKLYDEIAPSKEALLSTLKDNEKEFKENSALPDVIKNNIEETCFTLEDLEKKINYEKLCLDLLQSDKEISKNDLKFLLKQSSAATLDSEGTFKITQEGYLTIRENANALGIKNADSVPNSTNILEKIRKREYCICNEKPVDQRGGIVDLALASHKTCIIFDEISGKKIKVQIGFVTSTKDGCTLKLDDYQQTNPDLNKQQKEQMFRIPSTFTVMNDNEFVTVDMETTLYFRDKNAAGQDISKLLYNAFAEKSDTWSNNPYQYPYIADEAFVRKLAILFQENKLKESQENLKKLQDELNTMSDQLYLEKLNALQYLKDEFLENNKNQKYFSLLPKSLQDLFKALKHFEEKKQKDNEQEKQKKHKQDLKNEMADKQAIRKEEKNNSTIKTAKEKKEAYLKKRKAFEETPVEKT